MGLAVKNVFVNHPKLSPYSSNTVIKPTAMDIPRNEYGFVLEIGISPKTNLESSPSIGIQPMK